MTTKQRKPDPILDPLNAKQLEAVSHKKGPLLILAGPGSGKTRVVTHRIAFLIREGAKAETILGVTFTNKAADQMRQRVEQLIASAQIKSNNNPWLMTFHAFCARVLREEAKLKQRPHFLIFDRDDTRKLIKEIIKELSLDERRFSPGFLISAISSAKNELLGPDEYANNFTSFPYSEIAKVYKRYNEELQKYKGLDFDDLLMETVLLMRNQEQAREKYSRQFEYILIDEYQDTNPVQYEIVKLLTRDNSNLCVVGDDAQSIYAFRGADFRNILRFEQDWPQAKVVRLEQNYRSTKNILEAAQAIVEKNKYRTKKRLWTESGRGQSISVIEFINEHEEAEFVAEKAKELIDAKTLPEEIAVLYRTNAQSRIIENAFLSVGVPYKIIGGLRFYDRKEIKDMIAFMRLVQYPGEKLSSERIINIPPRGIGAKNQKRARGFLHNALQQLHEGGGFDADGLKALPPRIQPAVGNLLAVYKEAFNISSLKELALHFIRELDLQGYYNDNTEQGITRWENIGELLTVLKEYDKLKSSLGKFLDDCALLTSADERTKHTVSLMTLHAAKGLEFDTVFITGCEEGLMPHSRSVYDPFDLEEERRLCYVGITRAKKRLFMTYARQRHSFGRPQRSPRSRFIEDLPSKTIEHITLD